MTTLLISMLMSFQSHAMLVGLVNSERLDTRRPTTLFVVGRGDELVTQFQMSAISAAHRTAEAFPDRQIMILSVTEKNNATEAAQWVARGVRVIEQSAEILTEETILARIRGLRQIASLHVFAHMNPVTGAQLEQRPYRILPDSETWIELRSRFMPNSFAILHGCNSAWSMAPQLARIWGIPVAGSFVASDFQRLRADGFWYVNNKGQHPEDGQWSSVNNMSFQKPYTCQGTCLRMRPDDFPYKGIWGDFRGGGLGINKFFLPENRVRPNWLKAMALSLFEQPSVKPLSLASSQADFDDVVLDHACIADRTRTRHKACLEGLTKAITENDMTFDPFRGQKIQCGWTSCNARIDCSNFENLVMNDICKVVNPGAASKTTTYMDQLMAYRAGFAALKSGR